MYHFSVSGEDYSTADPFTATFNSGNVSSTANITIIDDDVLEENVTSFMLSVTGSDVQGFPLTAQALVSIIDNEGTTIMGRAPNSI